MNALPSITCALGAGNSVDVVDTLPLRSSDDFSQIRAAAFFEMKYFSGAVGSMMSGNVDALSFLGQPTFCVKHTPFNNIPQLRKRKENFSEGLPLIMDKKCSDVFKQKSCRPLISDDSGKLKEQSSAGIGKAFSKSAARESLVILNSG